MAIILVGSRAIKEWFPDFRECDDFDYWADDEHSHIPVSKGVEIKNVSQYPNLKSFLHRVWQRKYPNRYMINTPTAEELYALKVSHSFWNKHWEKTMMDILFFQEKRVYLDLDLVRSIYKDWEIVHGKKQGYLNVPNEKFFTKSVDRVYIHDDLHESIKFYDEPLYKKIKTDQSKALTSNRLFEALSFEDKVKIVNEEAYVTALERFLIPSNFQMNPLEAYQRAMKLLITSMTRGEFALWIVANFQHVKDPLIDFSQKFKDNEHKCRKIKDRYEQRVN